MLGSATRMFTARLRRLRALECFRFGPIDAICYFPVRRAAAATLKYVRKRPGRTGPTRGHRAVAQARES